jgi:hypothetical protein
VTSAGAGALLDNASIGGQGLGVLRDGGRYVTVFDAADVRPAYVRFQTWHGRGRTVLSFALPIRLDSIEFTSIESIC